MDQFIVIKNAQEHNLKGISVSIPKNKLVIFTGVSGSGKSSLAMDTIYAEGQRRYVESLSSYARQFLGVMKKPDVESIDGLSPAIAIDQKTVSHNPRSTVGTVTEIYDYLRLLFARIGHPHCPQCGMEISHMSIDQIVTAILETSGKSKKPKRVLILSPIIKDRKGEYSQLFSNLTKQGFSKVRVDGKIYELDSDINLIKTNKHTIEVLVDRLVLSKDATSRLSQSIENALALANGYVIVSEVLDAAFEFPEFPNEMLDHLYSEKFACPVCNIAMPEIAPRSFSFNSPHGACEDCNGLGTELKIEERSILAEDLSVLEGGIIPWASLMDKETWNRSIVESVSRKYGIDLNRPVRNLPKEHLNTLFYGTGNEKFDIRYKGNPMQARFEGVIPNLERRFHETNSEYIKSEIQKYMIKEDCPTCHGDRLNRSALGVTILGKNISEVSDLSTKESLEWINKVSKSASSKEIEIGKAIILEIVARLEFLIDVGLTYLTLSRTSATLAGGEAQRIRLASQVGSKLSGILYVLDEPSIGLHPRDHLRLIKTLKNLRDLGNSVLVVEHDEQTMLESDYIIDFGPGAGQLGGTITAMGTPEEIMKDKNSLTGAYLSGRKKIEIKKYFTSDDLVFLDNKTSSEKKMLKILNCSGNNLKNIDVEIPLHKFVCITGVSGSGKSTLVNETINKMLRQELGLKNNEAPAKNDGIIGSDMLDKVINIDQNPIGRTPRSNPATYTKVFDEVRTLFAMSESAKIRGYKPGRFSFNVKGGRCEACQGDGQIKIEMQFMPDVYIDCEICGGKRYNRETLEVEFRNKNIAEVLDMTIDEAMGFFTNHTGIAQKLSTLQDVGLGYLKLGQPAPTLSGGEAQRIKLASELSKRATGNTFYILDEPTTGLHFADLERLIAIIKRLVLRGNTVLVIEHNLDVIKHADWIIDLGPEGGKYGGEIMFEGTVSELMADKKSYTGEALRAAQKK
ncbi:excinuclease ABC subunit UvrA [candidate division WWE3 bacterium CG_4_9_14_0_2_um_filter_35_11]|uniref:UvrABC system protein A n=1 Tax=candidate division WWE3 bacterium CG_4_9_14_0_2_um_filter_35_11 TaxID=1975077 RepID=A0A2M8EM01_UNCKA|nr:MAG: excinuclease ABC subunit A [candidate division WWE3 bacterium CG10_big_fil_rev_8_21_14_0_10_35_32]PJC23761.1 MAG: excinuclease ABC subunit UvrA [candidate division WWE3 bacterium CG_4_9_14_0_2_um_filter_35_11]